MGAIERTALGLIFILAVAVFLLVRKHWLLGSAGVALALGLGMLGATRFSLWGVSWVAGQVVMFVALVALGVGVLRSRRRGSLSSGPS